MERLGIIDLTHQNLEYQGDPFRQDFLVISQYAWTVENKPPPKPIPVVPLEGNTLAANIAFVGFSPGNSNIQLQVADQRSISAPQLGDPLPEVIYEIGRFSLTPRALRQLLDAAVAAAKAYEGAVGSPLPTMDQFIARAAITTLMPPTIPPPAEGDQPE